MKNTIGNNLSITLFGESHGDVMGVVMDGLPAGIEINEELLNHQMGLRKAHGLISTQRHEDDEVQFVSGIFEGKTTGMPVCILIPNKNQNSQDYDAVRGIARPSHADYVAHVKYGGHQDTRGGGHFSGRLTAPLVAAGAIAVQLLNQKGIFLATHIKQLHTICDDDFAKDEKGLLNQITEMNSKQFAVLNNESAEKMISIIEEARKNLDAVGGILETVVLNFPIGVGEPTFDSVESRLSHALFSIGAVKGVEFGLGFDFADQFASQVNDEFRLVDGRVFTTTNHNGGVNGGISNGMPLQFKTVIKPTPSIGQKQKTINFLTNEETDIETMGRHDPAIIHRARVVVDSMVALTLVDCMMDTYGRAYFMGDRK